MPQFFACSVKVVEQINEWKNKYQVSESSSIQIKVHKFQIVIIYF